jgi:hypothetical protein
MDEHGSANEEPRELYLSRIASSRDHFLHIFSSALSAFRFGGGEEEPLLGDGDRDVSDEALRRGSRGDDGSMPDFDN